MNEFEFETIVIGLYGNNGLGEGGELRSENDGRDNSVDGNSLAKNDARVGLVDEGGWISR